MASTVSILTIDHPASSRTPEPMEAKRITKPLFPVDLPSNLPKRNSQYGKNGPATLHGLRVNSSQELSTNKKALRIDDTASISNASPIPRRSLSSQSPVYYNPSNRISRCRSRQESFRQAEHDFISIPLETPVSIESINEARPDEVDRESVQRAPSEESITPKFKIKDYGAPPLNKIHFSCYQFHRFFIPSNNFRYPLQCMTCLKSDLEIRWRCIFCCLRVCRDCLGGIRKCKDRSLIDFMEKLVQSLET